jgi:hypothetical protein
MGLNLKSSLVNEGDNAMRKDQKRTRYIIIGPNRSGTTLVHLALEGHPNASALSDEMRVSTFFTRGIRTFTYGSELPEERERGFSALFDAVTLLRGSADTMAHGAKIANNSPRLARVVVETLRNSLPDMKIIIMARKDLVAQYGSLLHMRRSGILHSWYEGFKTLKVRRMRISKWRFLAYCINLENMHRALQDLKLTHDVLNIEFEDLLSNPGAVYERLFQFLGLPPVLPNWIDSKKVLPPPERYIKNYAELTAVLERFRQGNLSSTSLWVAELLARSLERLRHLKRKYFLCI